jgi:glutamyl-tRNA reductase
MFSFVGGHRLANFASVTSNSAASRSVAMQADASTKATVLVTGAGGKTGKLVAKKLKDSSEYNLRAVCRTEEVHNLILGLYVACLESVWMLVAALKSAT